MEKYKLPVELESEDPRNWGKFALCKGKPSEWWFVEKYSTMEGRQFARQAKEVCGRCAVKLQCLKLANDNDEAFGIWGGLTPKERGYRRMNKQF